MSRFRVSVKAPLFYVVDDANDLGLHAEKREINVLPDWIFVREIRARENVVDHDHYRRIFVILR